MQVYLSEQAELKLQKLNQYLLEEWGQKVRKEFLERFSDKINQISMQPESCPRSNVFGELYKCVVSRHTTFYYRIGFEKDEIEIITLFDTRQNPDRLSREIK